MSRLFPWLALMLFLSSCKVFYPNYLLRETKDYYYYELQEAESQKQVIMPDDRISFSLYTRDGFRMIDVFGEGEKGGSSGSGGSNFGYLVKEDGYVELPLLGDVYVKGMTRLELEDYLEEKYSTLYNDPFIQLSVTNRRVYVFAGIGGARVVSLPAENTKLIEVIAIIGGIGSGSKSHKIRIIRGDYNNPSIKKVDLSTIEGLKDADFIVQPNDLIIIDPVTRVDLLVVNRINQILSLVTALTTVYLLVLSYTKL